MKAMIFAAGLGTRLRPLTDTMPKALVSVGGVPMLERVIRKLRGYGIDEFVVNVHHFAPMIEHFLESNRNFGASIAVSHECDQALETGGGIKKAEPLLASGPFLVHNADILTGFDLNYLFDRVRPDALATLLLRDADSDRYLLFDDDMRLCGWTNAITGEVKSPFRDLDISRCHRYAFCGIHVISDTIFPLMADWPEKFGIIDFYLAVAAEHPIYGVVADDIRLVDIGSPDKLREAELMVQGSM